MKYATIIISIIIVIVFTLGLSSCKTNNSKSVIVNNSPTVDDVLSSRTTDGSDAGTTEATPDAAFAVSPSNSVDVDLTVLNSTMVYSEVYSMVTSPETFIGKSVRMSGAFAMQYGEGRNYYAVLIADAAACCAQGLEFVLENSDSLSYPKDYPTVGNTVTVVGTFNTYDEGGYTYCELVDAHFE